VGSRADLDEVAPIFRNLLENQSPSGDVVWLVSCNPLFHKVVNPAYQNCSRKLNFKNVAYRFPKEETAHGL